MIFPQKQQQARVPIVQVNNIHFSKSALFDSLSHGSTKYKVFDGVRIEWLFRVVMIDVRDITCLDLWMMQYVMKYIGEFLFGLHLVQFGGVGQTT